MTRWALSVALVSVTALGAEATTLVVCAPGYPSNTEQAQPTMDDLSGAARRAAGWDEDRLRAEYHPDVQGGLAALGRDDTGLALVPLHFYLEYRERFDLRPLLQVVQDDGPTETWSLVARKGAVDGPGALAGWELAGMAGYSPRFVRNVAFGAWGELPDDLNVRFSSRVLSVLRKVAEGENVAAILDQAQTGALKSLPFADDLDVVASSEPLVGSLLCRVGDHIDDATAATLRAAFLRLADLEEDELLETIRIRKFVELPADVLQPIEQRFGDDGS